MRLFVILLLGTALIGCNNLETGSADLGAAPPTDKAHLFAPGVVNRGLPCRDVAQTPDGDVMVWCELVGNFHRAVITEARRVNGAWGNPRIASFSTDSRWKNFEPAFSRDGRRLFFVSDRPLAGEGPPEEVSNIWVVDRTESGWGVPTPLPEAVNEGDTFFPSVTRDGTLYLTKNLEGGESAIFRSRLVGGQYQTAMRLPEQVNAGRTRFNAMVDADERFLIVPVFGLADSRGGVDYYLVARNSDDTWADPVNMGDLVNSAARQEWSPSLAPDGSAFFFMSDRPDSSRDDANPLTRESLRELHNTSGCGQMGIWWIDAHAVDVLRPYLDGAPH